MKILALIDSFKGTITSKELGKMVHDTFEKKGHYVTNYAIADGGDGFLDAISENISLEKELIKCHNPLNEIIDSYYLVDKRNNTAYIELAKASGISLIKESSLNPLITTTYGLGEMILDSIKKVYKHIVIGIGGSATNDGGTGMLEAMGVIFKSKKETLKYLCNEKLSEIDSIEISEFNELIKGVKFTVLSDVTNPLLGENGATYVFSKQKGATLETLPILESNMKHYASFNETYTNYPGSGAAGGVGYALKTYFHTEVISGIDYLLDLIDYDNLHKYYDVIITGEGKIDSQSLQGKVISSIINRTKDKKVILVCAINELKNTNFEIHSVVNGLVTKEMSMENPKKYFKESLSSINL